MGYKINSALPGWQTEMITIPESKAQWDSTMSQGQPESEGYSPALNS